MGVVYKLRQDVVLGILKLKKEEPSLSCRKITALIREQFDITLSKSSVNGILKNSQLSSSVGRRPLKKTTVKKFELPASKKLASASRLGGETEGLILEEDLTVSSSDVAKGGTSKGFSCDEKLEGLGGGYNHNVGAVFLKIAERFLFDNQAMLRAFLPKECLISPSAIELLEYMCFYGVSQLENLDNCEDHDLWDFVGSHDRRMVISSIEGSNLDYAQVLCEIKKTIPFLLAEVDYCQMVNLSGLSLFFSGDFYVLSEERSFVRKCPKTAVLSKIRKYIIDNSDIIYFKWFMIECFTDNRLNMQPEQFLNKTIKIFSFFSDNNNNSIDRINLIDGKGKDDTLVILPKKRYILGSIPPDQQLASFLFSKSNGGREITSITYLQEVFKIEDSLINSEHIRLVKVYSNNSSYLLISNNIYEKTETIVSEYLTRYHNPMEVKDELSKWDRRHPSFDFLQIWRIINRPGVFGLSELNKLQWMIMEFLNYYVGKRLFSFEKSYTFAEMKAKFYSIPGLIQFKNNYCFVKILLSEESSLRQEICFAVNQANRMGVKDVNGRRICLQIA